MKFFMKYLLDLFNVSGLLPPIDEEIKKFSIDAITSNGKVELTEERRLRAQLVEEGAEWVRWQITRKQ